MRKTHKTIEILAGNETPGRNNRGPAQFKGQLYLDYTSGRFYRATEVGPNALWELFLPDTLTESEINDAIVKVGSENFVALNELLESTSFYREGDSYDDGNQGADQASRPFARLAARFNMGTVTKTSVAGTRMDQILARLFASYSINHRGLVGIADGILNDVFQYADDAGKVTSREAFRSALAWIGGRASTGLNSPSLFFGPGWSNGASSTAQSYVDVAFSTAEAYLLVGFVTGSGGTIKIYDNGTLVRTVTTGGYKNNFTGAIRLSGTGSSTKTFRVVLDSGSVTIVTLVPRAATPPLVIWDQAGRIGRNATEDTRIAAYNTECASILGNFPEVVSVPPGPDWNPATMISAEDGIHRNDRGNIYALEQIQKALLARLPATPYQGLNRISASGAAPTYVAPTAAYTSPGASAPAAPSAPSVSPLDTTAVVSWSRPVDNGATITGWVVQYRLTSSGSWTTRTGTIPAADTSVALTGLTASSSYETRVAAVNPAGTSSYSTSTPFNTTAPVVVYASDNFNRADGAAGSTPVGNYVWNGRHATTAPQISGNRLNTGTSNLNGAGVYSTIDDGQADGTLSLWTNGANNTGIAFRCRLWPTAAGQAAEAYLFWRQGTGSYALSKRTTAGAYTVLATISSVTPTAGDVLSVVMNGSLVKLRVNGIEVWSGTLTDYATNTEHGAFSVNNSTLVDDFSHTDQK